MAALKEISIGMVLFLGSIQNVNAASVQDCHFEFWDSTSMEWFGYHVVNFSLTHFAQQAGLNQGQIAVPLCKNILITVQDRQMPAEVWSVNSQAELDNVVGRLQTMSTELRGQRILTKEDVLLGAGAAGWLDGSSLAFVISTFNIASQLPTLGANIPYYSTVTRTIRFIPSLTNTDFRQNEVAFVICKARVSAALLNATVTSSSTTGGVASAVTDGAPLATTVRSGAAIPPAGTEEMPRSKTRPATGRSVRCGGEWCREATWMHYYACNTSDKCSEYVQTWVILATVVALITVIMAVDILLHFLL